MISIEIFSWVVKVILEASHSVRREITNMKYLKKKRERKKEQKWRIKSIHRKDISWAEEEF